MIHLYKKEEYALKSGFCCPVCGSALERGEKILSCENGHSFDIAKKGYVNLLLSQKSKDKRHGDDTAMITSRRDFLDLGYYLPLCEATTDAVLACAKDGDTLLDLGCGECYYTAAVMHEAEKRGIFLHALGIDISRDALIYGAKRYRRIELAAASIFSLPVADDSVDIIMNMFAPCAANEFARVLKKGGRMIQVYPREKHLFELKKAIYDTPYENDVETADFGGFRLISEKRLTYTFTLKNQNEIHELFMMTPYYYKTSKEGQARAAALTALSATADFAVAVYEKL